MNPFILYIETSGTVCSVVVAKGEQLLAEATTNEANSHAAQAPVFIQQVLQDAALSIHQLQAVALSNGPGSYTGLRIGASLAKGICYAAQKPLIAISTLQAMAYGISSLQANQWYCPMIDARRMEVYTALYDHNLQMLMPESALILNENSFQEFPLDKIIFFGNGAEKFSSVQPNARVENNFYLNARHLVTPALYKFRHKQYENTAYYEPNYLKPFYSTKKSV